MKKQLAPANERQHLSNEVTSAIIHLLGVAMGITILVILIVFGARRGGADYVVSFSLYGSFMIMLYAASSGYHLVPMRLRRAKEIAQRIDHAAIYLFIAATYTPITFIALPPGWGWSLFGIIWGCALLGASVRISGLKIPPIFLAGLYVVMGWLIMLAIRPLLDSISSTGFWLLLTGGFAYTGGVLFYILDHHLEKRRYFWMHEIFHLFVLAGSIMHVILMFYLLKL